MKHQNNKKAQRAVKTAHCAFFRAKLPIDPFKNRLPVTFECILVYLQELNFHLKNIHIYRVNESLSQGFLPIKIRIKEVIKNEKINKIFSIWARVAS